MRKLIWEGGHRFRLEENAPVPELGRSQVLVKTTAVGICGTDIHILEGKLRLARAPLVLGHEIAGIVVDTGPGVTLAKAGDRVTVDQVVGCGICELCRKGSRQFCERGFELGITADGGCQDLVVLPEENVYVLPDTVSDEAGAILDMEVWAALFKSGLRPGESVLIMGDGPAGLIACQVARAMGAGPIVLAAPAGPRMEKARQLELADTFLTTTEGPLRQQVRSIAGRYGVDVAMECAGAAEATRDAFDAVRPGGRVVLYGVHVKPLAEFDLNGIVLRDLVVFGTLSDRRGWREVIDLVSSGQLQLDALITHRFTLESAPAAYEAVRNRTDGLMKAVITLGKDSAS